LTQGLQSLINVLLFVIFLRGWEDGKGVNDENEKTETLEGRFASSHG
jgi:hypothetical protein